MALVIHVKTMHLFNVKEEETFLKSEIRSGCHENQTGPLVRPKKLKVLTFEVVEVPSRSEKSLISCLIAATLITQKSERCMKGNKKRIQSFGETDVPQHPQSFVASVNVWVKFIEK